MDNWRHIRATFNRVGAESKKAGTQFAYHNHWFEVMPMDGKLPYDLLVAEIDPDLVKSEVNLYWIAKSRLDTSSCIRDDSRCYR